MKYILKDISGKENVRAPSKWDNILFLWSEKFTIVGPPYMKLANHKISNTNDSRHPSHFWIPTLAMHSGV